MSTRPAPFPARATCALVVTLLAACSTPPLAVEDMTEPALVEIHGALVDAVAWARTNPEISWWSGWTGNAVVHSTDERTLGLCYEWQELVWDFTRPVAERVGWRVDGIAINVGTWSQHHAVVVWDPARVHRENLLDLPPGAPAYVLDAWRRGAPDVYPIGAWIDIPVMVMTPPELEDLETEYGGVRRFGPAPPTAPPAVTPRP